MKLKFVYIDKVHILIQWQMVTPTDAPSAIEYICNHTHETRRILQDGNSYSLTWIKYWLWWWWWWNNNNMPTLYSELFSSSFTWSSSSTFWYTLIQCNIKQTLKIMEPIHSDSNCLLQHQTTFNSSLIVWFLKVLQGLISATSCSFNSSPSVRYIYRLYGTWQQLPERQTKIRVLLHKTFCESILVTRPCKTITSENVISPWWLCGVQWPQWPVVRQHPYMLQDRINTEELETCISVNGSCHRLSDQSHAYNSWE